MEKNETAHSTPPSDIRIRPANPADAEVIHAFLCDLEETTLDRTAFDQVFSHNLTNPMIIYLVAEQASAVVGFVSCHMQWLLHHTGKVGEIQELYVAPSHRSQRIGGQLINALNALADEHHLVNLEVTTNQKRLDTIRFYEQNGFRNTHYKLIKSLSAA